LLPFCLNHLKTGHICPVFKWSLKTGWLNNRTDLDHLINGQVRFLDVWNYTDRHHLQGVKNLITISPQLNRIGKFTKVENKPVTAFQKYVFACKHKSRERISIKCSLVQQPILRLIYNCTTVLNPSSCLEISLFTSIDFS
jgi:hypothetical protein